MKLETLEDYDALYRGWLGEPAKIVPVGDAMRIYAFAPTEDQDIPMWTYLSAGMSLQRMTLPEDAEAHGVPARTEYVFYSAQDDARYVSMLALLMIFPFEDKTFVTFGHTVSLGEPVDDSGAMTSVVLLSTLFKGHEKAFASVKIGEDRVGYLWPVPITDKEKSVKKEKGLDALLELMAEKDNPLVFPPDRKPML